MATWEAGVLEEPTVPVAMRELFADLADDEDRLRELVARLAEVISQAIPEYRTLPDEVLLAGVRHTVTAGLGTAKHGRLPDSDELRGIAEIIADRARRGLSLAAILDAYHLAGQEFWTIVADEGRRRGFTDADLLPMIEVVRRWIDSVTVAAATAHHQVGIDSAREDEARTGAALRALLDQPVPAESAGVHLVQLGLDPVGHYAAVRGRAAEGVTAPALREGFPPGSSVIAVVDRDVVGLLGDAVVVDERLGTFGVGPLRPAAELYESGVTAGRAFAAAAQLHRQGLHTLDELRLAAVAATDPEMAKIVSDRLLGPLREKGRYGDDVWRSVVSYLEHGFRVDETAAAMHVHPNTLRHRLAQFTMLTGADLRNPADIAETWWLATVDPRR